ncbi:neprilysin-3-like [Calliphora vicina]|uniref:neprilysin-3-like n=1 Tax=Calliphora vicina TaxID=7373 RepID=UPI00325A620A
MKKLKIVTKLQYGVIVLLIMPNVQSAFSFNAREYIHNIFDLPNKMSESQLLHNFGIYMQANMNESVNPCDDFYQYACGNWAHNPRVPEFGHNLSVVETTQHVLHNLAIDFLENKKQFSNNKEEESGEKKAKVFYKSCMNTKQSVRTGLKLLLRQEKEIFERLKFSGKDDWLEVNFMSPFGIYPLLPLIIKTTVSASAEYEITLDLPQPYLATCFRSNSDKNNFLKSVRIKSKNFQKLLQFERQLISKAKERQPTERLTLREFLLRHKYDIINWNVFFDKVFSNQTQYFWYINNHIDNMDQLHDFLQNTPIVTLRKYVKLCTIVKFYKIWSKRSMVQENRKQYCRYLTEKYFRYALMPWFQQHLFNPAAHNDLKRMAEFIKQNFINSIQNYKWLSRKTKFNVQQKLEDLELIIGYTNKTISKTFRMKLYGDLQITTNWFKNLQQLEAHFSRLLLQSVHHKLAAPLLSPFAANSFYNSILNIVFLSMGIAQMPLYHQDLPVVLKFGGMGVYIAHEIAHALDSHSYLHKFDARKHKYSDKLWLSLRSSKNFENRWLCLKHQYEDFLYQGKSIYNSASFMTENVADNAMLHLSYSAYKNLNAGWKRGFRKPLWDLDFTNDQLFFIKFAQIFCNAAVDKNEEQYGVGTPEDRKHVYDEFRVLLPLQNMPAFSKSFKCKLGSPMNPLQKCRLW